MDRKHNSELTPNSRVLRKNMTKEERHLWYDFLKTYPVRFNRQKVLGKYIADFYCNTAKLVIELDGSQHFEEKGLVQDAQRTEYLEQYGLTVIRIANNMVNRRFDEVCEYIDNFVRNSLKGIDTAPQSPDGDSSPCTGEP